MRNSFHCGRFLPSGEMTTFAPLRGTFRFLIATLPPWVILTFSFWPRAVAPVVAEERLKVAVSNFSASYLPMFIAVKRGYYAEEGMAVDIILIAGLLGTKAVMSNSVDFGSASNPTAAVQGARLKMLMVFNDKPPGILAAQPGIKSVSELRGKKIGGSTVGSLEYGWLKELLPKFGLQLEKDVIFLPIGPTSMRYAALRMGTIDASPLSPPSSLLVQDAGYAALLRFADHLEDIQASIVTTDDRLASQSELVRRFMRATVKGQRVYLSNRQEAISFIMEFTRQKDRELATRVYDDHLKTIARDGTISERLQRVVIERSKRLVGVTREIRAEEIFDFSYLRRAQAELNQSGWTP
jgi:ABC-type nitrate/sulfonate/bicarbonate transport system substrate-binding protein